MRKITPFLWFDTQAEEAVAFYLSVFKDGKIQTTTRYPENGPRPAGTVMTIAFELQGQQFVALNGRPKFAFNPERVTTNASKRSAFKSEIESEVRCPRSSILDSWLRKLNPVCAACYT